MGGRNRDRSAAAKAYRALYKTDAWRAKREAKLTADPLCERCIRMDDVVPATVVHHRIPHRGDLRLFWSDDNLESLCAPCHDGEAQREEKTGKAAVWTGLDGWPVG
jgi:5-methylcytosine-specific restriction endonuclease McrA